jgi:tellurium resistance protein TerD
MSNILNLEKNDILDLTKKDPSLNNILLGSGWDVVKKGFFSMQADYDLDLIALLLDSNDKLMGKGGLIYFGNQKGTGIYLHGDNRTGAGDGDDEKISISLNSLPKNCNKVIFAVNIYDAMKRKQSFSKVKNAYVRLVNEDKGNAEICRYNLTDEGGDNTAIIFAELEKSCGDWKFKAVGEYLQASVSSLAQRYR